MVDARIVARAAGKRRQLVKLWLSVFVATALLTGCATSTIQTRIKEKPEAYQGLSSEEKALVDQGQIKVGMKPDAIYIAWGPPSEVLEREDASGHVTTWVYHGQWMEETRYWTYREMSRNGEPFLERHLESDYYPRSYVRAEIDFVNGQVVRWRTLPRPL